MHKNGIRNYLFCVCFAVCALATTPIGTGRRASAQTASTDPSFELATIKPVTTSFDPKHFWVHVYPARSSYWSMTPASSLLFRPSM